MAVVIKTSSSVIAARAIIVRPGLAARPLCRNSASAQFLTAPPSPLAVSAEIILVLVSVFIFFNV